MPTTVMLDANGADLSEQMAQRIYSLIRPAFAVTAISMPLYQWRKLQAGYGHLDPTLDMDMSDDKMIFASRTVTIDNTIPWQQVWFYDAAGDIVAKIGGCS